MANVSKDLMTKVTVCEICGDSGFSDCLAICSHCKKGAEHVYCMGSIPTGTVPPDWVCETCTKSKDTHFLRLRKRRKSTESKSVSFAKGSDKAVITEKNAPQISCEVHMASLARVIISKNTSIPVIDDCEAETGMSFGLGTDTNSLSTKAETIIEKSMENIDVSISNKAEMLDSASGLAQEIVGLGTDTISLSAKAETIIEKSMENTDVSISKKAEMLDSANCLAQEKLRTVIEETTSRPSKNANESLGSRKEQPRHGSANDNTIEQTGGLSTNSKDIVDRYVKNNMRVQAEHAAEVSDPRLEGYRCRKCNRFGHLARICSNEPTQEARKFSPEELSKQLSNNSSPEILNEVVIPDCTVKMTCSSEHQRREREFTSYGNIQPEKSLLPSKNKLNPKRVIDADHQKFYENRYEQKERFKHSEVPLKPFSDSGASVSCPNSLLSTCIPPGYHQVALDKANRLKQVHLSNEGSKDDSLNRKKMQSERDIVSSRADHHCTSGPHLLRTSNDLAVDHPLPCPIEPFLVQAVPDTRALWGGCLTIHWKSLVERYKRFRAHPSNMADPKVCKTMTTLPSELHLDVVRRGIGNDTWPRSFNECPPTTANIGMFFFSEDMQSYTKWYRPLLDRLSSQDLVLQMKLEIAHLLIYPSCLLPKKEHYWDGRRYLWGIFRANKKRGLMESSDNGEVIDMDIDMVGGAEVLTTHG